jgi:hypothetical protein
MSSTQVSTEQQPAAGAPVAATVDLKLEVMAIPVSDVDAPRPSTRDWGGRSTPISWSGRTFERSS